MNFLTQLQEGTLYRQIPEIYFRELLKGFAAADFEINPYKHKLSGEAKDEAYKALQDQIYGEILCPSEGIDASAIFYMCKLLETAQHIGTVSERAGRLLRRIRDMTRESSASQCESFCNVEAWKAAFEYAHSAEVITGHKIRSLAVSREKAHGDALRFLKNRGFDYQLHSFGFGLKDNSLRKVCKAAERRIAMIGGITTINHMLHYMKQCDKFHEGVFQHARLTGTWNVMPRPPNLPWKFIYGLAIKHFTEGEKQIPLDSMLQKMGDLTKNIGASFNVEPYSSYENISAEHASWLAVTFDTLCYDELFALPQWQPDAADFLIPAFAKHLKPILERYALDMPFGGEEAWKALAENTIRNADLIGLKPLNKTVDRAPLKPCIGMANELNQKFRTPFQNQERDEFSYPFLAGSRGHVWVHPKSIASRSFMESTFAALRREFIAKGENFDGEIGPVLDEITIDVLKHFGHEVSVKNKKYSIRRGANIEADIVVETENTIFFIECTKKALTDAARRGDLNTYVRDLDGSFLKNARQLLRHEATLKANGSLKFENGYVLEHKGRTVEKIAINIFDHGSLQNLMTTGPLLRMLCSSKLEYSDPEMKGTCESANRKIEGIKESIETILDLSDDRDKAFQIASMSTFWFSIDQFFYLLLKGGDLGTGLSLIRNVSYQSGDLIFDIKARGTLSEQGKQVEEWMRENNGGGRLLI